MLPMSLHFFHVRKFLRAVPSYLGDCLCHRGWQVMAEGNGGHDSISGGGKVDDGWYRGHHSWEVGCPTMSDMWTWCIVIFTSAITWNGNGEDPKFPCHLSQHTNIHQTAKLPTWAPLFLTAKLLDVDVIKDELEKDLDMSDHQILWLFIVLTDIGKWRFWNGNWMLEGYSRFNKDIYEHHLESWNRIFHWNM